jgi:hypothetical protein
MEYAPGDLGPRAKGTQSTIVSWGLVTEQEQEFWTFHIDNPEVYRLFCKFAYVAINHGHTRLASKLIINQVRWFTNVLTTTSDYKINDKWKAYYSRLFMLDKHMPNFFETRLLFGENELFTGYPSDYPDELQEASTTR